MAHAITIDSTQVALNQHLVTYAPQVKQVFRTGLEFETMTGSIGIVSADDVYTAENVSLGQMIQPYQPRFTPKNTESWNAVDNTLRPVKIDLQFSEEQLFKFIDKWRNEWFEAGKNPTEWSYPRYLTENLIAPKWREEMNRLAWLGEYVEPTPGTAGDYLESVDGYKIAIANAITAGKLVPVASGSYTSSDIRSKQEDWMRAMPEAVRGRSGVVLMSDTNARDYYYDFRGDFATATWSNLQANGGLMVDGFPVRIIGVKGMEGSNRWIFLPDGEQNMIVGTRRGYPMYPQFILDHDLYNLNMKAVMYRFFGFEYWDNLYVNDQA
jgi:hypothetical protein